MKKLYLDSVIYSLQDYGGITNYWNALIDGIGRSEQYGDFSSNTEKMKNNGKIQSMLSRYFTLDIGSHHNIFHSSYYRTCRNYGVNNVVTVYDFMYEKYTQGIKSKIHSCQKKKALARADLILCISHSTKQDLEEMYPSYRNRQIIVTHLGVDHGKYYPQIDYNLHKDEVKIILFVGRRSGYKRFDIAIEIIKKLQNYKLGIVGEILRKDEFEHLENTIPGRYIHYGRVNNERLRVLYNQSFCMLIPSEYEGFGLPLLEAQACGCPVVASNTSSLAEIGISSVKFGNNSNVDSYIESIIQLEENDHRRKFIELGLLNSKKYTWENCIKATIEAYNTIC